MKWKRQIIFLLGIAGSLLAVVLLSGCGNDSTGTSSAASLGQCKADQPSIIPPPSGKPQHVYFFRDT